MCCRYSCNKAIRMYKKLDKVLARRVRFPSRFTNCAQCQHSYRRNIDRDAVCHPVGHALRDEWATVPDSCVVRVLPIVRLLIQGSCGPVGNASEPLLFTVGPVAAGLRSPAQPCLSYPPPPRLFRLLKHPQTAPVPVQTRGLNSAAPANRRATLASPYCRRDSRCRRSAGRKMPLSSSQRLADCAAGKV